MPWSDVNGSRVPAASSGAGAPVLLECNRFASAWRPLDCGERRT